MFELLMNPNHSIQLIKHFTNLKREGHWGMKSHNGPHTCHQTKHNWMPDLCSLVSVMGEKPCLSTDGPNANGWRMGWLLLSNSLHIRQSVRAAAVSLSYPLNKQVNHRRSAMKYNDNAFNHVKVSVSGLKPTWNKGFTQVRRHWTPSHRKGIFFMLKLWAKERK